MHWHSLAHPPIQSRCFINVCRKWFYKYIYEFWNLHCQKTEKSPSVRKNTEQWKHSNSLVCSICMYDMYYIYYMYFIQNISKSCYQVIFRCIKENVYKKGRFKEKSCLNLFYCCFAKGIYSEYQSKALKSSVWRNLNMCECICLSWRRMLTEINHF